MFEKQSVDSGIIAGDHVGAAFKVTGPAVPGTVVVLVWHRSKLSRDGLGDSVVRCTHPQLLEIGGKYFRSRHGPCVLTPNESCSSNQAGTGNPDDQGRQQ